MRDEEGRIESEPRGEAGMNVLVLEGRLKSPDYSGELRWWNVSRRVEVPFRPVDGDVLRLEGPKRWTIGIRPHSVGMAEDERAEHAILDVTLREVRWSPRRMCFVARLPFERDVPERDRPGQLMRVLKTRGWKVEPTYAKPVNQTGDVGDVLREQLGAVQVFPFDEPTDHVDREG